MIERRTPLAIAAALVVGALASPASSKPTTKTIRGEISDGTSLSNVGSYSFENGTAAAKAIFKVCKVGDMCEVEADVDDDMIRKVRSAKPASAASDKPDAYLGGWTEDAKGCAKPLVEGALSPGEYVFRKDARYHFEGRCRIVRSEPDGSFGWKLDETCGGQPGNKARWTISVAGDTMIASIARGSAKAGEPFTLKRCAAR